MVRQRDGTKTEMKSVLCGMMYVELCGAAEMSRVGGNNETRKISSAVDGQ